MRIEDIDPKRLPISGDGKNPYPITEHILKKAPIVSKYIVNYLQPIMKPEYDFFWNIKSAGMLSDIAEMEMMGAITHRQGRDIVQHVVKEIKRVEKELRSHLERM